MFRLRRTFLTLCTLLFLGQLAAIRPAIAADYEFHISFSPEVRKEPYTGRVYLFFSRDLQAEKEPRQGPDWFHPEPFVSIDVQDWKPETPLRICSCEPDGLYSFPKPMAELELKGLRVQAVARFNPFDRNVGTGEGNGISAVQMVEDPEGSKTNPSLTINRLVPPRAFPGNEWCKLLEVPSPLLTAFHKRDVALKASVLLPQSYYKEPDRRFPVIFSIPGFGGTHFLGVRPEPVAEKNPGGVEFVRVMLDPSCPLGHHVFADSANNGPYGTALVTELIPELDRRFRTVAQPAARFLTGHSSGGWSSLWVMVTHPDVFGGTWSTAPDPVDFHDFQEIDMYRAGENMYRNAAGERRPIARRNGKVLLWYDDFDLMETVLGYGGQLHSFEAVFSPRGPDGKPLLAWSRDTGAVDVKTTKDWEKYDIRLVLESRWTELAPKLKGKLHVIMGDADNFYLEGATRRLKASLEKLGSDAVVELVPGKDHFTLYSRELLERIRLEMAQSYLRSFP